MRTMKCKRYLSLDDVSLAVHKSFHSLLAGLSFEVRHSFSASSLFSLPRVNVCRVPSNVTIALFPLRILLSWVDFVRMDGRTESLVLTRYSLNTATTVLLLLYYHLLLPSSLPDANWTRARGEVGVIRVCRGRAKSHAFVVLRSYNTSSTAKFKHSSNQK